LAESWRVVGITGVYAVSGVVRLAEDASRILGVSVWVRSVSKKPLKAWWSRPLL